MEQLSVFVIKLGHYSIVLWIPWLWLLEVAVQFAFNMVMFGSRYCTRHRHDTPSTVHGVMEGLPQPGYSPSKGIFEPRICPQQPLRGNIVMLNRCLFFRTGRKGKLRVFKASLYDINKAIEPNELKECPLEQLVPKEYHGFLPLFNLVSADWLPPYRPGIDHEVRLKDREISTSGPLYSMSLIKLVVLKEWLEENMSKGTIR